MNNLIYAENSNLTRMRHQLNAAGTGELIRISSLSMAGLRSSSKIFHCLGPRQSVM